MAISTLNSKQQKIVDEIPLVTDSSGIYFYVASHKMDSEYISILDKIIGLSTEVLASWLNITPRTFRNYRSNNSLSLKDNLKEHIILILSLYKHGIEVFDNVSQFEDWLTQKNYLLDNRTPASFLGTISGISFIDDRLTAMEYGENV